MITVWGEGRGFRVVWLLEEMGLPYRLRPVDLLADLADDPEFLAVNPGGFIPALVDGEVTMVESIAIMQYLLARYGPTPLAPDAADPMFPTYLQFLHMGEAGLMGTLFTAFSARVLAPEAERDSWLARQSTSNFASRLGLVRRQLEASPYIAGAAFTAADISVAYAVQWAERTGTYTLGEMERAYVSRCTERDAYHRAMDTCQATKAWAASVADRTSAA